MHHTQKCTCTKTLVTINLAKNKAEVELGPMVDVTETTFLDPTKHIFMLMNLNICATCIYKVEC